MRGHICVLFLAVFLASCSTTSSRKRFPPWNRFDFQLRVTDLPVVLLVGRIGKNYDRAVKAGYELAHHLCGVTTLKQFLALPELMRKTKDELVLLLEHRGVSPVKDNGLPLLVQTLRVVYPPGPGDVIVYWHGFAPVEHDVFKRLPIKRVYRRVLFEAYQPNKQGIADKLLSEKEHERIAQLLSATEGMGPGAKGQYYRFRPPHRLSEKIWRKEVRFGDMWFRLVFYEIQGRRMHKCVAVPGVIVFDFPVFMIFTLHDGIWAVYFPARNFYWENPAPGLCEW